MSYVHSRNFVFLVVLLIVPACRDGSQFPKPLEAKSTRGELRTEVADHGDIQVTIPPLGTGFFRIPDRSEIKEIRIELYNATLGDAPLDEFTVTGDDIDAIYKYFDGGEVDVSPIVISPETVCLRLQLETGEIIHIIVFGFYAKRPLSFSLMGVRMTQNRDEWARGSKNPAGSFHDLVRRLEGTSRQKVLKSKDAP